MRYEAWKTNWFYFFCVGLLFWFIVVFTLCAAYLGLFQADVEPWVAWVGMNTAILLPFLVVGGYWLYQTRYGLKRVCFARTKTQSRLLGGLLWAVILCGAFLIRFFWILHVAPQPISDFHVYYTLAEALSNHTVAYQDYVALFPHVIGLPSVLTFVFRLFGGGLWSALVFNVVAATVSVFLIGRIGTMIFDARCGKIAACLFALYPPSIFFCALVSTENFHLCLTLAAILCLGKAYRAKSIWTSLFSSALFGMFLALGNAIRPVTTLLLAALIFCLVLFLKKNRKTLLRAIGMFLAAFTVFALLQQGIAFQIERTIDRPIAQGNMGYNFAVGMNRGSFGAWNPEDAILLNQFQQQSSASEAHRSMMELAIGRATENPWGTLQLILAKTGLVWGDEQSGLFFLTQSYSERGGQRPDDMFAAAGTLAQMYYVGLLVLVACGLFRLLVKREFHPLIFFVVVTLGAIAAFGILEAQSRYRFFVMPALMLMAVYPFLVNRRSVCIASENEPVRLQ